MDNNVQLRKTLFEREIFEMFVKPNEVVEIRVLGVGGNSKSTWCGYFDNYVLFRQSMQEILKRQYSGCYFTLQVIDERLLARANNHMKQSDLTTSDRDVRFYRWFPIDLDPVRPSGISSSDSELKMAMDLRDPIAAWVMQEFGLSDRLMAMSGNGAHLLFRLPDLPVNEDNKAIIKGMLEDISKKFSTDNVKIDTKVYNPARIWKLYGTITRKGDEILPTQYHEGRTHRKAYIDNLGGIYGC